MSKLFAVAGFAIYVIVGLYLLNVPFNFITMPGFIQSIESWIIFAGGILVIIGGIKYLFTSRRHDIAV